MVIVAPIASVVVFLLTAMAVIWVWRKRREGAQRDRIESSCSGLPAAGHVAGGNENIKMDVLADQSYADTEHVIITAGEGNLCQGLTGNTMPKGQCESSGVGGSYGQGKNEHQYLIATPAEPTASPDKQVFEVTQKESWGKDEYSGKAEEPLEDPSSAQDDATPCVHQINENQPFAKEHDP